jgi:hypothetical protein
MDFGVYGDKYAYQSWQDPKDHHALQPEKPIGVFLAKQDLITNLIVFFDHCWDSYESWVLPKKFFSTIRSGIAFSSDEKSVVITTKMKKISTVDLLLGAEKSTQSLKSVFDKSDLTVEDLRNPLS